MHQITNRCDACAFGAAEGLQRLDSGTVVDYDKDVLYSEHTQEPLSLSELCIRAISKNLP